VPARLYRVGGANSRDGGVDLWANFGPAIQVKHIALDLKNTQPIVESISAEQIVIVCKDADKPAIQAVLTQVGLGGRVRGIITKADLARWYDLALGPKHGADMAVPLFKSLLAEFDDEFTLADPAAIDKLIKERGYDKLKLEGTWSVAQPATRAVKPKNVKAPPYRKSKKGD
jgi:type II restriction enzyme